MDKCRWMWIAGEGWVTLPPSIIYGCVWAYVHMSAAWGLPGNVCVSAEHPAALSPHLATRGSGVLQGLIWTLPCLASLSFSPSPNLTLPKLAYLCLRWSITFKFKLTVISLTLPYAFYISLPKHQLNGPWPYSYLFIYLFLILPRLTSASLIWPDNLVRFMHWIKEEQEKHESTPNFSHV